MDNPKIISDPEVMVGKPLIAGTRITVEHILYELSNGLNIDQIVQDYPNLTKEDVLAALEFARENVHAVRVYPRPHAA